MKHLARLIKKSNKIYICGNGGSAALSDHFAADLIKKGYPAISLSSNTSVLTMIGNDYGYKFIFSKQLEVLANENDLLIAISCSGTSPNILQAIKIAKKMKMQIYSFETFGGDRDYQKLEDKHLKFMHQVIKKL